MTLDVDYFRIYNLTRDPFSNAPDPDFFYQSRQHFGVLQQLENTIRNFTGVNLIAGAPGTGKTTLLRHLYRKLCYEKNMDVLLLNAEYCESKAEFEQQILNVFGHFEYDPFMRTLHPDMHMDRLIETIRENDKKVVILIDDGHVIPEEGLQVLNRLADLEGNLQLVVFANRGFMDNVNHYPEFKVKISHYHVLGPLSFTDTRHMISHRLKIAGNTIKQISMFTYPALLAIYLATGGCPKKIVKLCHRLVLSMSIRKSMKAGWFQVRFCARRVLSKGSVFPDMIISSSVFILVIGLAFIFFSSFGEMDIQPVRKPAQVVPATIRTNPDAPVAPDVKEIGDSYEKTPERVDPVKESPVQEAIPLVESPVGPVNGDQSVLNEPAHIMSEDLGQVEVKRSDTLLVMLEKVYGHSQPLYRDAVSKANPHIANINNLNIGDRIIFPIIPVDVTPLFPETYWVRVASFSSLGDAFGFVRSWPSDAPSIKMIPFFRGDTGFRVDVVLKKTFTSMSQAQDSLETVVFVPSSEKKLIQFKLKDSLFFADPFFN
ncbi:MAG: AAA family ATPase [Proteobacteria bacterium]|nr:AAA family ATPase [Pseudomonadota bacterium]